jgi:hypothetical protein
MSLQLPTVDALLEPLSHRERGRGEGRGLPCRSIAPRTLTRPTSSARIWLAIPGDGAGTGGGTPSPGGRGEKQLLRIAEVP